MENIKTKDEITEENMPQECLRRGCNNRSRCIDKAGMFYGCTNMPADWGPIDPDSLS